MTERAAEPEIGVSVPRRATARRGRRFVWGLVTWFATLAVTLAGLLVFTFALGETSPADPALHLVGDHASDATYQAARRSLGLDQPVATRFVAYVDRVLHGDLGTSWATGDSVAADIARVFPATLELSTVALAIGTIVGLTLAVLSALRPGGTLDAVVRIVSLIGYSVPIFWLGLLMLLLFYARLHWAAGPGQLDDLIAYTIDRPTGSALFDTWLSGQPGALTDALKHMILPALVLAVHVLAGIARLTRAALLAELDKDYVVAARARGAGRLRIILCHALPNVSGVVVTVVALGYTTLLEGAIFTETVFAWPGIGRYMSTAVFAADMPAILGGTLAIGTAFVTVNAVADLIVRRLDPRVRA
ncbi:ABC transporter permease [Segnochrobactrum spirostomi]|uniref:ABC transporter permease n=1 Tax=Segnochrobactrum spirostomi TaxID=2608987 RepID=UPI0028A8D6EB|nr:ABC transporter permease [Segnochrobactrum spirostomi]